MTSASPRINSPGSLKGFALILAVAACTAILVEPVPGASTQWPQAARERGYVVFRYSPMQILGSDYVPPASAIVNKVSAELARGERESIFIGVRNFAIPPKPYQPGSAGQVGRDGRALINVWAEPTIDLDVKVYWRNMEPHQLVPGNVIGRINVGRTGGFWFTISATPQTLAGVHTGKIMIVPANGPPTELKLEVRVLPFVLSRARPSYAAYFRQSDDPYVGYRRRFAEDVAWRRAIYTNMAEYGMTSVDFDERGGLFDDTGQLMPAKTRAAFERELDLAMKSGLVGPHTPVNFDSVPPKGASMAKAASELRKLRSRKGWPEFLWYLHDEPTYPDPKVRQTALQWRGSPFRVVTSLNIAAAYGLGDVHDVWIAHARHITPEMKAEAHRLGAEVWTYTGIHLSHRQPLRNRFFAGLYTWAQGLGGNWIWAYYRNGDYNHQIWSHNSNNVFYPTVGYEMRREGIDDYRYLQMLEDSIAAKSNDETAVEAATWLKALRKRIVHDHLLSRRMPVNPDRIVPGDPLELHEYDAIRRKAAKYIERLGAVPSRNFRPWAQTGLKDEAARFRDKPTDVCIGALANSDSSVRRAAALALYERGAQAAAAVDELARLLDDPEVRIPALRALEAIGPAAAPALARVKALLLHHDPFIRLGATFTLVAMGPPAAEALSTVRDDPLSWISNAAKTAARH